MIPDSGDVCVRLGIGPCRVGVERAANANMKVSRGALDRTDRRVLTRLKQAFLDPRRREVMVSFDDDCLVALGDGGVFPDC